MLRFIAVGMAVGAMVPWESTGFPYLPDGIHRWTNVRQNVINAQGKNKSILDVGCGIGFSTSSSRGSLGIDTDPDMLAKAQKLFPEKHFEFGDVLLWKSRNKFDVVTSMFYLHENPRYIRAEIVKMALKTAKERVVFVDLAPDYCGTEELYKRKPFLKDYLLHCQEDLRDFEEHVLVKGKLHMWVREISASGQ